MKFSYENKIPIILVGESPFYFDKVEPEEKTWYISNALQLWERLKFEISMAGLNLVGNKAKSINLSFCDKLIVTSKRGRNYTYDYEHIYIYKTENIVGLGEALRQTRETRIIDIFKVHRGKNLSEIKRENGEFYRVLRFEADETKSLYAIVENIVPEEQKNDFEFSSVFVRLNLEAEFEKERGTKFIFYDRVEETIIKESRKNTSTMTFVNNG